MTKYINKLTGAELDYDKVHEDFERSLTWDHETDPEEFLMEAYEFEYSSLPSSYQRYAADNDT